LFAVLSCWFLIKNNIPAAIFLFLIAAFLDLVDGSVARHRNIAKKSGAYLDTIIDRYVEGILLFGMLFLPLPVVLLPSYIWIFLVLFGSLATDYVKAAGREKGLAVQELKGGLLSRGERIILFLTVLILGIFNFSWMVYLLIIMAALTNLTAFQRIKANIESKI
jgi:phosphatidylglycerophosphate synthase